MSMSNEGVHLRYKQMQMSKWNIIASEVTTIDEWILMLIREAAAIY
jgi:hypothetical protein